MVKKKGLSKGKERVRTVELSLSKDGEDTEIITRCKVDRG